MASAILETLGIDPLLSAKMIYRSSDKVWEQVKDDIMSFAGKWHIQGRVDRAVQFMIDTGRAEFSRYIMPSISNPGDHIHLRALRSGRRFLISVLAFGCGTSFNCSIESLACPIVSPPLSRLGTDQYEFQPVSVYAIIGGAYEEGFLSCKCDTLQ